MQARIDHDLWYIRNQSLMLDLRIVFRTFLSVSRLDAYSIRLVYRVRGTHDEVRECILVTGGAGFMAPISVSDYCRMAMRCCASTIFTLVRATMCITLF